MLTVIRRLLVSRNILLFLLLPVSLLAQESLAQQNIAGNEPLPDPLTLDYALSLKSEAHPELLQSQAEIMAGQAAQQLAGSRNDFNLSLDSQLRWINPPDWVTIQEPDDHKIALTLSKQLYDFGRTDALLDAADAQLDSAQWAHRYAQNRYTIQILQDYFSVVLADIRYRRENEAMAIAYIRMDKARDRHELSQLSDVDLLKEETAYQRVRRLRYEAQNQQRLTRAVLAQTLNRPGNLPANVEYPRLKLSQRELPEFAQIEQVLFEQNPYLQSLQLKLSAANDRLKAIDAENNPIINAELETAGYSHKRGSRDSDVTATINMKIPLYQGRQVSGKLLKLQSEIMQLESSLELAKRQLSRQLLASWLRVQSLMAQQDEAQTQLDYRELYLDRSRALYEMEFSTDFGDSMVEYSQAELLEAETDFALALAWANIDALLGRDPAAELLAQ